MRAIVVITLSTLALGAALVGCGHDEVGGPPIEAEAIDWEGHCEGFVDAAGTESSCVAWWGSSSTIGPSADELCQDLGGDWAPGACPIEEALGRCHIELDGELGEEWTWYDQDQVAPGEHLGRCEELGGHWIPTGAS